MKINKKVFIPTISFIFIVLILVVFNLSAVQNSVNYIYKYLSHNFSWLFILSNIAALIFSFYMAMQQYVQVLFVLSEKSIHPTQTYRPVPR